VLDVSAMWCPYCQNLAPVGQRLAEEHGADGLSVVTVIFQDAGGDAPDAADLETWASTFGLTHAVLADEAETVWTAYDHGYQPTVLVIDRTFTIRWIEIGNDAAGSVEAAVMEWL